MQTYIAAAMSEMRVELQSGIAARVIQAIRAQKETPLSPAPSQTSRQWTGTYAGQMDGENRIPILDHGPWLLQESSWWLVDFDIHLYLSGRFMVTLMLL